MLKMTSLNKVSIVMFKLTRVYMSLLLGSLRTPVDNLYLSKIDFFAPGCIQNVKKGGSTTLSSTFY